MFPRKSPRIRELEDTGLWGLCRGQQEAVRNTGTYGLPAGPWLRRLSSPPSLLRQCPTLTQLASSHRPHAQLNNRTNCKDGDVIIASSGKYANRKLDKLRGKQRQSRPLPTRPGCRRRKPEGGHVPGGAGRASTAPALGPIFICELALKLRRLLTDRARAHSRAEESGN